MVDIERYGDSVVQCLRTAVTEGRFGLSDVPDLLKKVIQEGLWRQRIIEQTGERAAFDRFIDFVQTKPLEGLGSDLTTLKRLCHDDPEALDWLDKATQGKHGGDRKSEEIKFDNIKLDSPPTGTDRQYALRKLRKSRPDLHAKVLAKELSPNAAMVAAGFRKQTATVALEPVALARLIQRRFNRDEIIRLVGLLTQGE